MTTRQNVQTPKGTYQVFSNQIQGGLFVASVVYFLRRAGNPNDETDLGSMDFKLHTEHAATEEQALGALLRWCESAFGQHANMADGRL
jgi:hypothetical protein